MAARRALVVDDSKSARVVLSRMLERYGLEVDSAESAEQALDYLKSNRPDVIFMDHMMPGMDGLQAVQRIKTDTSTAAIPVMMYTSQEGELYVGQARALGAVGVLPKTVRPVDVTKVLYQLRLLPDRRDPSPSMFQPADGARPGPEPGAVPMAANDGSAAPVAVEIGPQLEKLLHDQTIELRRFFVATLDSSAQRIVTELRPREGDAPPAVEPPPAPLPRPWGWISAAAAAALALVVVSFLYWQSLETAREVEAARVRLEQESGALRGMLEQVREAVAQRNAGFAPPLAGGAPAPAGTGLRAAAPAPGSVSMPADLRVPYGELPLAPSRVDALRASLADLQRRGFQGVVRIGLHAGEFCLAESPAGGFVLAEPATPVAKCTVVGNPYLDGLDASDRQPLAFANLVDSVKADTRGRMNVVLVERGRQDAAVAYPTGDGVLAGDWNRAALANNRVTVALDAR